MRLRGLALAPRSIVQSGVYAPNGMRGAWAYLALLAAGTIAWIPAYAGAVERATISTNLKANGSGLLIANSQTNSENETWDWLACSSDLSSCAAFGKGRTISTSGARPNTRFRATSSYGATAISSLWRGNLRPFKPPMVTGILRADKRVTPSPGQWRGGWSDDYDVFQLAACESPKGLRCTTLPTCITPVDARTVRRCSIPSSLAAISASPIGASAPAMLSPTSPFRPLMGEGSGARIG
jgi:hypothetical protein